MYFGRKSIRTAPARPADREACLPWQARFALRAPRQREEREEAEKAREPGRARVARRATLPRELGHFAIVRRLDEASGGRKSMQGRVCGLFPRVNQIED